MGRIDHYNNPDAPPANSVVPSTTAVVVDSQGRILLVHRRDNGLWALPGGGMDLGESIVDCAIREVCEETGMNVTITSLIGTYTNPRHVMAYDDGEVRQQFSLCFAAELIDGDLRADSESTEVAWVDVSELDDLSMHPSMRLRINHYLEHRPTPYLG